MWRNDAYQPLDFFQAIWRDQKEGNLLFWKLKTKTSYWVNLKTEVPIEFFNFHLLPGCTEDIYMGTCLRRYKPNGWSSHERGGRDDILIVSGVWLDLDYGAQHKGKNRFSDEAQTLDFVHEIPIQPTMLVHSGHGLQAWWLFKEPFEILDNDDDFAFIEGVTQGWNTYAQTLAKQKYNASIDSVGDLARVLRVPGTINAKDPKEKVPVKLCEQISGYPDLTDIQDLLKDVFTKKTHVPDTIEPTSTILNPLAVAPEEKLKTLKYSSKAFRNLWNHEKEVESQSERDFQLALYALSAGWGDQEITDALIQNRREHDQDLKLKSVWGSQKTRLKTYYTHTIDKAKAGLNDFIPGKGGRPRDTSEDSIPELTPEEIQQQFSRDDIIGQLRQFLGITVERFIKFAAKKPTYELHFNDGHICYLPTVSTLIEGGRFRTALAESLNRVIKKPKPKTHDYTINCLFAIMEEFPVYARPGEEVGVFLRDFLNLTRHAPPAQTAHAESIFRRAIPFYYEDKICLYITDLVKMSRLPTRLVGETLTELGWKEEVIFSEFEDAIPQHVWVNTRVNVEAWLGHTLPGQDKGTPTELDIR